MGRSTKPRTAKPRKGHTAATAGKAGKRTHAKGARPGAAAAGMLSPAAKSAALGAVLPKTPVSCLRKTVLLAGASQSAGKAGGASICWSPTLVTRKETTWSAEQYDRSPCAQPKIYCCDYCGLYFRGTRHHCEECEDFDVCDTCWSQKPPVQSFCDHDRGSYSLQDEVAEDDDGAESLAEDAAGSEDDDPSWP